MNSDPAFYDKTNRANDRELIVQLHLCNNHEDALKTLNMAKESEWWSSSCFLFQRKCRGKCLVMDHGAFEPVFIDGVCVFTPSPRVLVGHFPELSPGPGRILTFVSRTYSMYKRWATSCKSWGASETRHQSPARTSEGCFIQVEKECIITRRL